MSEENVNKKRYLLTLSEPITDEINHVDYWYVLADCYPAIYGFVIDSFFGAVIINKDIIKVAGEFPVGSDTSVMIPPAMLLDLT